MISMLNALDVLSSAEKPSRSGYEEDELFLSDEDDSECHLDNAHAESAFLTLQHVQSAQKSSETQHLVVATNPYACAFLMAHYSHALHSEELLARILETDGTQEGSVFVNVYQVNVGLTFALVTDSVRTFHSRFYHDAASLLLEAYRPTKNVLERASVNTVHLEQDAEPPYLRYLSTSKTIRPNADIHLKQLEAPNMIQAFEASLFTHAWQHDIQALVLASLVPSIATVGEMAMHTTAAYHILFDLIPELDQSETSQCKTKASALMYRDALAMIGHGKKNFSSIITNALLYL